MQNDAPQSLPYAARRCAGSVVHTGFCTGWKVIRLIPVPFQLAGNAVSDEREYLRA